MAAIPGTIPYTGQVAPTDTTDTFPTHDSIWGKGGLREVANNVDRNAITTERRTAGMLVYTADSNTYWRLLPGPWVGTDADWVSFAGGGGYPVGAQPLTNGVPVVVDTIPVDAAGSVTWFITLYNTTGRREVWKVEASHDGYSAADATAVQAERKGMGPNTGFITLIDVTLTGTGVTQAMNLVVTAGAANWSCEFIRFYQTAGAA